MPNFQPGYIHQGGPCAELYWCYALRCRVEREQDKAYYWPQLARLMDVLEPFIAGWKDAKFETDQALQRLIGKKELGWSYSNAPTGGVQKLTREKLEYAATRYLSDNAHLIAKFENNGAHAQEMFIPGGPGKVHFFRTEFFASRTRLAYDRSQDYRFLPHDLRLEIGGYNHQYTTSRADPINQALELRVWQGLTDAATIDALALAIGALSGAVQIWRAESGFCGEPYVDTDGNNTVRFIARETIEDAIDGHNRYGSQWRDLLRRD